MRYVNFSHLNYHFGQVVAMYMRDLKGSKMGPKRDESKSDIHSEIYI